MNALKHPLSKPGLTVGIVGKIGSGKSTVASVLMKDYDFELIDVDRIGHQALVSEKNRLVEEFGTGILNPQGEVDRLTLGNLVFAHPVLLNKLNNIVHPVIRSRVTETVSHNPQPRYLIDAALLFEIGLDELCDFIISIDAPSECIISRVSARRKWPQEKIQAVLTAQKYLDFLKDKCHFIIFNNGDLQKLRKQIEFFMLEIS